jgi:fructosamine-3-kinase
VTLIAALTAAIGAATGTSFEVATRRSVSGGDINQAEVLTGRDGRCFFVKRNTADRLAMFEAEADGLREILASGTLLAPGPVCSGRADGQAYLVLDYLDLGGRGSDAELGRQLAAMHRVSQERFGWWRDNSIGATHQSNASHEDWPTFWRDRRLGFQLALARRRGAPGHMLSLGERLLGSVDAFFTTYHPVPSLLHGDLWGGNYGFLQGGEPVIFDPAVYYGDREADLAMTELFGGFSAHFHAAYREAWPLDPGYGARKTLYNLYHVLNHYNLFGGGYAGQAAAMVDRLLAELG